ncbi:Rrf2 family transcriptional regulator [Campylobacter sp. RM9344]|uniref:Rrf2 family transcriptional regulator n=1 Tax=Campylobacter californiensis TaxID=1032243 RepID=A0AAW3ZUQ7_9BACT|nr:MULTISPECIES: Rrf2 family transcriptional regulator [unclassified Campylobacter]MBE2984780.1 Rrf2 family transcriptional regulator [Campylobacter sp. RM6883]MBE2986484.1 Rrf2 family transcriptional regulator [Campylobacter sp. RM12919]MBE2987684.1 Rrf2 family transcriptional regulator [Campylobacter sp. RM12920]MBE2994754.1 Rrf2 family transcriptional regulator [Campylobacter sp. RM6913]MBE3022332.1 Rrf2 family transcriptional regulator [Campylobacter sp. 7477a]MBE3029620.1 Rrf2 family tra
MLFTKASEYALLSLILISQKSSPVDVDTISNELQISKSFLAKILQNLAKEKILKSYKGANGGFTLECDPTTVSVKKVIECAEKRPMSVFECSGSAEGCSSQRASTCQIWSMFSTLQSKVDEMLDDIKLSDIIKK